MVEELKPALSPRGIEKSGRVLKAFSLLYVPFYGLSPSVVFDHLGTFGVISAAVYDADERNETPSIVRRPNLRWLRAFLKRRRLLDPTIARYLRDGERWLAFERRYLRQGARGLQDTLCAMRWRSSDFRILHTALLRLVQLREELRIFEAFAALEFLMEVDDDISSFNRDRLAGHFNFVSALLELFGADYAATLGTIRGRALTDLRAYRKGLRPQERERFARTVRTYFTLVPEPKLANGAAT